MVGLATALGTPIGVLGGIARGGFPRIAVINHHLEPAHFKLVHAAATEAHALVLKTLESAHA